MSYEHQHAVRALRGLSLAEKAVLQMIALRASDAGTCYPSQQCLAGDTGASVRTVRAALDSLERRGLIRRQRRHSGRGQRSTDLITLTLSGIVLPAKDAVRSLPADDATRGDEPTGKRRLSYRQTSPGNSKGIAKENNYPSAQPASAVQEIISNSLGCKSASIDRQLLQRAEGFGLPVDEIVRRVAAEQPRNPSAYFQSIAKRQLREKVPGLNDAVIGRALSGDAGAIGAIQNILIMAEAA